MKSVLVVLLGLSWGLVAGNAQQPDQDAPGAQVLTRGPVHEAFAGMVTYNPKPGVVVSKAVPAMIEEVPPEERPQGDNVTWIPGYWAWDDERSDFLWVSGTWRALPPGRQWIAGYWGKTSQGFQWTSGYWADAMAKEATYLSAPPATVEVGPNVAAPSADYGWTPGCWVWYSGRYAWQPGYWVQGHADWNWMPPHYVWTPRGYIFVGGYWDYPVERRGLLFAPVYFESGFHARSGYIYSPTIVIDVGVFTDHLFLRPYYGHYYFGDYYAPSYIHGGFYASFSFQSSHHGYDPFYSHHRWEHRHDNKWEHHVQASYEHRRDHENARPPRTWAAQKSIKPGAADAGENRMLVAKPISQVVRIKDSPLRFQPVAKDERQKLAKRGQEVQASRDQRKKLESIVPEPASRKPDGAIKPSSVPLARSPIVARPVSQMGKNQAPPKAPHAPKPDAKSQPNPEPAARPPVTDRSNPPSEPRKIEPRKQSAPGRSEAAPRERQVQPEPRKPESQPTAQGEQKKARDPVQPQLRMTPPPVRQRPPQVEKGAARLLRRDSQDKGEKQQQPSEKPDGPR